MCTIPQMFEKVCDIVLHNREVKVKKIAKTLVTSTEHVNSLCRWVPLLLIADQKREKPEFQI